MNRDIVQGSRLKKSKGLDGIAIAEVLSAAYLKQRRPDGFTQKKTFAPSSIAYSKGKCPRYWSIAFSGEEFEENTDAMGIANMANGTQAHERIEQLFEDAGILIEKEVEILLSDPPIRGFADVMIQWNGKTVIGEIKTTRSDMFAHRKATMKPSVNHLLQILIYMHAK